MFHFGGKLPFVSLKGEFSWWPYSEEQLEVFWSLLLQVGKQTHPKEL